MCANSTRLGHNRNKYRYIHTPREMVIEWGNQNKSHEWLGSPLSYVSSSISICRPFFLAREGLDWLTYFHMLGTRFSIRPLRTLLLKVAEMKTVLRLENVVMRKCDLNWSRSKPKPWPRSERIANADERNQEGESAGTSLVRHPLETIQH